MAKSVFVEGGVDGWIYVQSSEQKSIRYFCHMRYDICCVGHMTIDKVMTPKATVFMPGGTSFYFSHAIANAHLQYVLVTALAASEMYALSTLRDRDINVKVLPSSSTVLFENTYSYNQDYRTQRVLQQADAFTQEQLLEVEADIYHLGLLLAGDIPAHAIKVLATKGKVSLDVQGFLRRVEAQKVLAADWMEKKEVLPSIHFLKANEAELKVLTGESDIFIGAKKLAQWGAKEVVITLGSNGAVIYSEGNFHTISAYMPLRVTDATGCGDTFMAGYLSQRIKHVNIREAGHFAAAMAALKIQEAGPFTGTEEEVKAVLKKQLLTQNVKE